MCSNRVWCLSKTNTSKVNFLAGVIILGWLVINFSASKPVAKKYNSGAPTAISSRIYCERVRVWEQTKTGIQRLLHSSAGGEEVLVLAARLLFFVPGHLFSTRVFQQGHCFNAGCPNNGKWREWTGEPGLLKTTCFDGLHVVGWCGVMIGFLFWPQKRSTLNFSPPDLTTPHNFEPYCEYVAEHMGNITEDRLSSLRDWFCPYHENWAIRGKHCILKIALIYVMTPETVLKLWHPV